MSMQLSAMQSAPLYHLGPIQQAGAPHPWLSTGRLHLRELCWRDTDDVVRLHQDPRVCASLFGTLPRQREAAAEFVRRMQALYREQEGLGTWFAHRMATLFTREELADRGLQATLTPQALQHLSQPQPKLIGWFSLMPATTNPREVELACRLLPAAWGQGYALEGAEALLRHAFLSLKRERVWAVCHPQHDAARYCALCLGFEDMGLQPYGKVAARHFLLDRSTWLVHHMLSRRSRMRHALTQCGKPARL